MAFSHGSKAVMMLADATAASRNITAYLTSTGMSRMADTAEVSTLGNTAKAYIPGMTDGTIPLEGPFDPTVDGYMDGLVGFATLVAYEFYPNGTPVGPTKPKYAGVCLVTSYEISTSTDDAATWSGELQLSGTITRTIA